MSRAVRHFRRPEPHVIGMCFIVACRIGELLKYTISSRNT
jgi:hypothetical protein